LFILTDRFVDTSKAIFIFYVLWKEQEKTFGFCSVALKEKIIDTIRSLRQERANATDTWTYLPSSHFEYLHRLRGKA